MRDWGASGEPPSFWSAKHYFGKRVRTVDYAYSRRKPYYIFSYGTGR